MKKLAEVEKEFFLFFDSYILKKGKGLGINLMENEDECLDTIESIEFLSPQKLFEDVFSKFNNSYVSHIEFFEYDLKSNDPDDYNVIFIWTK